MLLVSFACRQGFDAPGSGDAGSTDSSLPDGQSGNVGFGEECDDTTTRCVEGLSCTGGSCSCVTVLVANEHDTCILEPTGEVYCSGDNTNGELGQGMLGGSSLSPVLINNLPGASHISLGAFHVTALTEGGELWSWGRVDDEMPAPLPYRIRIPNEGMTGSASGGFHSCALTTNQTVYCWGRNSSGQLGTGGTSDPEMTPMRVATLENVVALASGNEHSCAIVSGGEVFCWGLNLDGQVGDGLVGGVRATPTKVVGVAGAIEISLGDFHSCALSDDGKVRCWGENNEAQLGRGLAGPSDAVASEVVVISDSVAISSGDDANCAISRTGVMSCWGRNSSGQFGVADAELLVPSPIEFPIAKPAISADLGRSHVCALQDDGAVLCAGANNLGQYGSGDGASSSTPVLSLYGCR